MRALPIAGLVMLLTTGLVSAPSAPVMVLAELFTSEGCSSCPPADRLLETLLRDQPIAGVRIVAMSEHVDYWDHQGWRDPFSSAEITERQQTYGRRFNLESVYTPQLVIDGGAEVVGSDESAVRAAIARAARSPKAALRVEVARRGSEWTASVTDAASPSNRADAAGLFVALVEDGLVIDVKRGENANHTLHHSAVVRRLTSSELRSPSATGTHAYRLAVDPAWHAEKLRVVAFAADRKTGRIVAIGETQ